MLHRKNNVFGQHPTFLQLGPARTPTKILRPYTGETFTILPGQDITLIDSDVIEIGSLSFNFFFLHTSYYDETYEGETKKIPDGYDLIGFAIKKDFTGAIESIGFTCWKKPQI